MNRPTRQAADIMHEGHKRWRHVYDAQAADAYMDHIEAENKRLRAANMDMNGGLLALRRAQALIKRLLSQRNALYKGALSDGHSRYWRLAKHCKLCKAMRDSKTGAALDGIGKETTGT